jgi:hypothetical protein
MAWADIDFNLLIPGMITRGPSEVSFSDYLNAFSTALDERQALIGDILNQIIVSDIRFEVGEIRNTIFWDKLRDMIGGYNELWFHPDNTFYEVGVLTDTLNPNDYLISDTDLETAMGVDAYDILVNYSSMSNQEIFKAALFTGLYELLNLTFYVQKPVGKTNSSFIYENLPLYFTDDLTYDWVGASANNASNETYGEALADYNGSLAGTTPPRGNLITSHFINEQDQRYVSIGDGHWKIDSSSRDYLAYSLLSKDLNDVVLSMDYALGPLRVENNNTTDTSTGSSVQTAYTNRYPLVVDGSVEAAAYIGSTLQDNTRGSIQESYIMESEGQDAPVLGVMTNKSNGDFNKRSRVEVWATIPIVSYIDLNNSALKYYITP